jgi:hypothetical protein
MATMKTLEKAGYTVTVAFGDAWPEHDRLDELKKQTAPAKLKAAAEDISAEIAKTLPADYPRAERLVLLADAEAHALEHLQERAASAVAHQERAVNVAEAMATVYRVEGHGISMLVADNDTDTITALSKAAR